jgi:hypothetical protein
VQLTITLEEYGPLQTEARIVRCRPDSRGEISFEVGARFLSLSAADLVKLAAVVNRSLKEQWGAE